jgi:hypothetical protein
MKTTVAVVLLVGFWWWFVRPLWRRWREQSELFAAVTAADWRERLTVWWTRLRVAAKGYKMILWGRLQKYIGLALPALDAVDVFSLQGLLPAITYGGLDVQPYSYVPLIGLVTGQITEWLRKTVTTPAKETDMSLAAPVLGDAAVPLDLSIDYVAPRKRSRRRKVA